MAAPPFTTHPSPPHLQAPYHVMDILPVEDVPVPDARHRPRSEAVAEDQGADVRRPQIGWDGLRGVYGGQWLEWNHWFQLWFQHVSANEDETFANDSS